MTNQLRTVSRPVPWAVLALAGMTLLLAACSSPRHRAPVEIRGTEARPAEVVLAPAAAASAPATAAAATPSTDASGRPLTFAVRPGDTLIRIGLETGQNWRDLARWNGIDNPNVLEVGQVLRVAPPAAEASTTVATRPVTGPGRVESRPLDAKPESPASAPVAAPAAAPAPAAATTPAASKDPDEDLGWIWPAAGAVLTPFDDTRSKGLAIGGKAGDPVLAAADGRVVYAGSGLRGYGNLVIVKHNNTYLSAYAHNQTLLVKEDQVVRRGQKIAEMGSSDASRVQLHFEIRRQGKPVDPARYLPPR